MLPRKRVGWRRALDQRPVTGQAGAVTRSSPAESLGALGQTCRPLFALGSAWLVTCHHPLQVEDPLPPVFSGTPKGSGAGYGVGFDLEEFLNQSFDMGVADGPQDG